MRRFSGIERAAPGVLAFTASPVAAITNGDQGPGPPVLRVIDTGAGQSLTQSASQSALLPAWRGREVTAPPRRPRIAPIAPAPVARTRRQRMEAQRRIACPPFGTQQ